MQVPNARCEYQGSSAVSSPRLTGDPLRMDSQTHPSINARAPSGLVSFASDIMRRPASPPSRRPSSTSTATPSFSARSTYGRASAMFSSSVYPHINSRLRAGHVRRLTSAWLASTMMLSKAIPCSARDRASSRCSESVAWSRWTAMGTEAWCALGRRRVIERAQHEHRHGSLTHSDRTAAKDPCRRRG